MNIARTIVAVTCALAGASLHAAQHECAAVTDNARRLACYDAAFGKAAPQLPAAAVAAPAAATAAAASGSPATAERKSLATTLLAPEPAKVRTLTDAWDLDPANNRAPFEIRPYKPVYLLFATHTDNVNTQPGSTKPGTTFPTTIPYDSTEAQFQLSLKTKVWDNIIGDNGTLWLGYTQSSRWQVYNGNISRPFRETNYEPEAMLSFRTPFSLLGMESRTMGLSLTHQSNGRANPLSRSWNRIIGQWGLERDNTMLLLRPWYRLKEDYAKDDNPGIENYMGRGEMILSHKWSNGHVLTFTGRHSLQFDNDSRGSGKLEWAIPISGKLNFYLTAFSGYGESMIDFNHRQNMIGAGFSLVEWQ